MAAHARLSPSSADRWMVCTASVPLIDRLIAAGELDESQLEGEREFISEDDIFASEDAAYQDVILEPERESTSFSAEGTVMHTIREMCFEFDLDPMNFVGQTMSADGFTFTIDEDMADRLVEGVDWVRQHTSNPLIEIRVDLSPWLPGQFGTCDCAFIFKYALYISDYKNGVGKPVEATNSRQLRLYALGVWHMLGRPDVKKIIINIDQPRAGGMKFWEITLAELLEFGEEVRRVYQRIESGKVEFCPTSKGCQWCPVRKTKRGCAAYNQWFIQMFGPALRDISENPSFVDPAQMPRAQRYYIVKHAADIKAWLVKLHAESLEAALSGDPDPGSKAIEGGEGNRFFTDPDQAKRILVGAIGRRAFKPRQLIGFTEIDKIMKPGRKKQGHPEAYEALNKLVDRPPGKPKLVPEDHPKPAYVPDYDFDDPE